MIPLLILSLCSEALFDVTLRSLLWPSSQLLQEACVHRFQGPLVEPLGAALICGRDLPGSDLKVLFMDTGLYHVLVVSGTHLIWVTYFWEILSSKVFNFFGAKEGARFSVTLVLLSLYSLMTGLQPPVVRSLLQLLIVRGSPSVSSPSLATPRLRPWDILLSYFLCLAFHPPWIRSLSLHLSVIATAVFLAPFSLVFKNVLVYFLVLPLIAALGIPSPLVIGIAFLCTPILEAFLFPLFLVMALFPSLQNSLESLVQAVIQVLTEFRDHAGSLRAPLFGTANDRRHTSWIGIYTLGVMMTLQGWTAWKRREWHFLDRRPSQNSKEEKTPQ